jgi:hypothetical protein
MAGRLAMLMVAAACSVLSADAQLGARTKCMPRIPLGRVCQTSVVLGEGNNPERNLWCVDNAYCDLGSGPVKGTGKCTKLPTLGNLCGNTLMCAAGLACNERGGKCVALPKEGERALYGGNGPDSGGETECAPGLGSYLVDGYWTCKNVTKMSSRNGSPGTIDKKCATGYTCGFYLAQYPNIEPCVCNVAKKLGQQCTREGECAAGLWASSTGCAAKLKAGSKCTDDVECVGTAFCAQKTLLGIPYGDKICRSPLPTLNEACTGGFGYGRCAPATPQLVCRV